MRSLLFLWLAVGCAPAPKEDAAPRSLAPVYWYPDDDGDGYGRCGRAQLAARGRPGFVTVCGDCADNKPDVHPGAVETCNQKDDDCDGIEDDKDPDLAADANAWYFDEDRDGHGGIDEPPRCIAYESWWWVQSHDDCDDTMKGVHPGLAEDCDPTIDADCDGDPLNGVDPDRCLAPPDATVSGAAVDDYAPIMGAVGDTDGDGNADLWYLTWARNYTVRGVPGPLSGEIDGTTGDLAIGDLGDFAYPVLLVDDVDGDGQDDVILGSSTGYESQPTWLVFQGPIVGERSGDSPDGSVTDDREAGWDAITGHFGADERLYGASSVYLGGSGEIRIVPLSASGTVDGASEGVTVSGTSGYAADMVGDDLNGDGIDDLVWIDSLWQFEQPLIWVMDGPFDGDRDITTGHAVKGNLRSWEWMPAATGDVDGDGIADLLVGDPGPLDDGDHLGAVFILPGPILAPDLATASRAELRGAPYQRAGASLAVLDLDADDQMEIAVGTSISYAGAPGGSVTVARGPFAGVVDLSTEDVRASANLEEKIGAALLTGDFVGDPTQDLVLAVNHLSAGHGATGAWEVFDGTGW